MTFQVLGIPQQAFLTVAEAVSHTGEVEAAITTVGASLGFERCQVESMPAAPDASTVAVWLHRGTAQAFGDVSQFPQKIRITQGAGVAAAVPDAVHVITSSHFATYRSLPGQSDEFMLVSARGLLKEDIQPHEGDEAIIQNLNMRIDDIEWGNGVRGVDVRVRNCLASMGINFIWQLLERFQTERAFDKVNVKHLGPKTKLPIKETLRKLGLGFGMKFPDGFVGSTQ